MDRSDDAAGKGTAEPRRGEWRTGSASIRKRAVPTTLCRWSFERGRKASG